MTTDTSAADALVSNPKNKHGVIKAFIVSNRSFLGTWAIAHPFLCACDILGSLFSFEILLRL